MNSKKPYGCSSAFRKRKSDASEPVSESWSRTEQYKVKEKRPTEIGWDTDDDESLSDYFFKRKRTFSDTSAKPDESSCPTEDRVKNPTCGLCSSDLDNNNVQDEHAVLESLERSSDASLELMGHRKWALVHGKFKVVTKKGMKELEESTSFKTEVSRYRPQRSIVYKRVPPGYTEAELNSHAKPCIAKRETKYSFIDAKLPGCCERHHVIWTNKDGDIRIDRLVKLYDMSSVHCHQIEVDCRGPHSPWFALADPKKVKTPDGRIHFDANLFWTVALLYKHFKTCGIQNWDLQLDEMKKKELIALKILRPPPKLPALPVRVSPQFTIPPPNVVQPRQPMPIPVMPLALKCLLHPPAPVIRKAEPPATLPGMSPKLNLRYTGCITEWMSTYGFINCDLIPGKIFLHCHDVLNWNAEAEILTGLSVNFSLGIDPDRRTYKAFSAKLYL